MKTYCKNGCGVTLESWWRFCPMCGKCLSPSTEAQPGEATVRAVRAQVKR